MQRTNEGSKKKRFICIMGMKYNKKAHINTNTIKLALFRDGRAGSSLDAVSDAVHLPNYQYIVLAIKNRPQFFLLVCLQVLA